MTTTSDTLRDDSLRQEASLVTWHTPIDPQNPLQWTKVTKWINVVLISIQGMLSPVASTLPGVATSAISADFNLTSPLAPTLPVAMYVLGLGIGPLYLAPLSELYGRRTIYIVSFTVFALLNVGCALAPNLAGLTILRFLSGMAGSAGPSLGGASIGDMFAKSERGKAQALYGLGPTAGPAIGGVVGGFILYGTGNWRWLLWVTAITPAITVVFCFFLLRETYGPLLLRRRAKLLRRESPSQLFRTDYDDVNVSNMLLLSATRPLRMLFTSPICASMATYVGIVYGILYLSLLNLSLLFGPEPQYGLYTYGWTHGTSGLAWLGVGIGTLIGSVLSAKYSNKTYQWRQAKMATKMSATQVDQDTTGQKQSAMTDHQPEARLFLLQIGMCVVPLGLIMYAWSAGRTHWIVPLIGAAIFATAMIIVYVAFQTYMVDIFGRFAASALATATVLRSILGCVFSVVGFQMYQTLGYAWGTMLLAFLCIAMIPLPFILERYGPKLRRKQFDF